MDKEKVRNIKNHLMTGVSYMIPFVVAGGMSYAFYTVLNEFGITLPFLSKLGEFGFSMIVPVLAGYLSYSIADKPGLGPGFIAGLAARSHDAGFLGAIVAGFLAGFVVKQLKKVDFHEHVEPLKAMMFIPFFGTAISAGAMLALGIPLGALQTGLNAWLESLQGVNAALLGAIIGGMLAFDMGGPINKAALTFVIGMYSQEVFEPNAAAFAGIMIPPLALGLATMLAPNKFTPIEKKNGIAALVTGAVGFTETAIPYAVADPLKVIPSTIAGSAIGGAMMMFFGVRANIPGGGFVSIPFFPKWHLALLSIIVGTLVTTTLLILLKNEPDEEIKNRFEGLDLEGN